MRATFAAALLAVPLWLLPVTLSQGQRVAGPPPVDAGLFPPAALHAGERRVAAVLAGPPAAR